MSNNQPNNHTILATPGRGDVTFPITRTTMDEITIGSITPADATVNNLVVNTNASGAGFVAGVNTVLAGASIGTAMNLAGGASGSIPYQTAAGTTAMLATGSDGNVLTLASGIPSWSSASSYNPASVAITGGTINGVTIGGTAPGSITGTTITASQLVSTISTGTAPLTVTSTTPVANLSIGGNAATANTATSATTATNIAGGANGSVPYQTGSGATTMLAAGTNGQVLQLSSGVPVWGNTPGLAQNAQTTSYTAVLSDAQKQIYFSGSTGSQTLTIPSNSSVSYPIGTALTFINVASVSVSIAITTDTLTWSPSGTTGTRTLAQYGIATAIKLTSTTWLISGQGLT